MFKPSYVKRILFDAEQLNEHISKAAEWINKNYQNTQKPPVLVCVLKGAVVFYTALLTKIEVDVEVDFTTLSSYRGTVQCTTDPKIVTNLSLSVKDRDVIIVEDILDTANTMSKLTQSIKDQKPKSISIVVLIDKPDCRQKSMIPNYACFTVYGNPFIIGFGIDASELGRNLPYIAEYDKEYTK